MVRMTVFLLLLLAGWTAESQSSEPEGVVSVSDTDAEMNDAIANARATLDEFLATHANPPAGAVGFKLKVMLEDPNGVEHFWVEPFRQTATGFEGTLANEPAVISGVTAGQLVSFKRADISDWGYVLQGRQIGSFTVCAMFKHMDAEEVAFYKTNHGFDCPE